MKHKWIVNEPIAVLQIVHGLTEHSGRYEELARFLNKNRISVVAMDLRGHGNSEYLHKSYFDGGWDAVIEDIAAFTNETKKKDTPYFIMGFSLGSFLVRSIMITHNLPVDGYIIAGTGWESKLLLKLIGFIVKIEGKKIGITNSSDFIKKLAFGTYNKNVKNPRTDFDFLCSDKNALSEYMNDKLCNKDISAGLFLDLINGMIFTEYKKNLKNMKKTKVLFISGTEEVVGRKGKGVKRITKVFKKFGMVVDLKLFHGMRHDIFHEKENEVVFNTIFKFISSHLK